MNFFISDAWAQTGGGGGGGLLGMAPLVIIGIIYYLFGNATQRFSEKVGVGLRLSP